MNKTTVISILVAALIIAGGQYLFPPKIVIQQPLGSSPSNEHLNPEYFYNSVTISGPATSSLTGGNFVAGDSTSTGIIMRTNTVNVCYLLHLTSNGALATSTASCN